MTTSITKPPPRTGREEHPEYRLADQPDSYS